MAYFQTETQISISRLFALRVWGAAIAAVFKRDGIGAEDVLAAQGRRAAARMAVDRLMR